MKFGRTVNRTQFDEISVYLLLEPMTSATHVWEPHFIKTVEAEFSNVSTPIFASKHS